MSANRGNIVGVTSKLALPCMEVMNFLNEVSDRYRSAISFAAGRPPDRFVSAERCSQWIARFVRERTLSTGLSEEQVWQSLGQYGPTNGAIGDLIALYLTRDEGIAADPAALMITNGMQEAALLLLLSICDRDRDVVLSDDPTYVGLAGAATLVDVAVRPLSRGGEAGRTLLERAERALASVERENRRVRALYVIPDFSNPMGQTLALEERRALLEFARRARLLLIEDTAYRTFRYEGESLPTLKALDRDGLVVQLGSFSKLFMPGPRVGYLYADQRAHLNGADTGRTLAEELSKAKSFVSVLTSPLVQATVGGFLMEQNFSVEAWNRPKIEACRENRDALLEGLEQTMGRDPILAEHVSWTRPEGGFFLTVNLPFAFATDEMMRCARDYGVIVCPMNYFSSDPAFDRCIRLSFSNVTRERAHEGTARLGRFIHDEMGRRA